ncbi:hypothetical protein KM92DES2_20471 [uncultured Desulfovibrio sp.]|uniref:Uncharacterized protein n=1 Tax=uncultured Desulfovibrio sp. TaxID=167968 RepID=A0A212KL51_9BACT|nr:hypothetical protein KM92DES2_20471 [uncultured Desulfovibrio sp.]
MKTSVGSVVRQSRFGSKCRLAPGFTPVKEIAQRVVAVNLEGGHSALLGWSIWTGFMSGNHGLLYKERMKWLHG